tara:strand:- start:54 stop:1652 length:1599 start_codon:yes stop_codon:yes gene_type:complete
MPEKEGSDDKKKSKKSVVNKEGIDLTKIAEAFGGYIILESAKNPKFFNKKTEDDFKKNKKNNKSSDVDPMANVDSSDVQQTKTEPTRVSDANYRALLKRVSGKISADDLDDQIERQRKVETELSTNRPKDIKVAKKVFRDVAKKRGVDLPKGLDKFTTKLNKGTDTTKIVRDPKTGETLANPSEPTQKEIDKKTKEVKDQSRATRGSKEELVNQGQFSADTRKKSEAPEITGDVGVKGGGTVTYGKDDKVDVTQSQTGKGGQTKFKNLNVTQSQTGKGGQTKFKNLNVTQSQTGKGGQLKFKDFNKKAVTKSQTDKGGQTGTVTYNTPDAETQTRTQPETPPDKGRVTTGNQIQGPLPKPQPKPEKETSGAGSTYANFAKQADAAQKSVLGATGGLAVKSLVPATAGLEASQRLKRGDKFGAGVSAVQAMGIPGVSFAAGVFNAMRSMSPKVAAQVSGAGGGGKPPKTAVGTMPPSGSGGGKSGGSGGTVGGVDATDLIGSQLPQIGDRLKRLRGIPGIEKSTRTGRRSAKQ